jgi:hypothetical protein
MLGTWKELGDIWVLGSRRVLRSRRELGGSFLDQLRQKITLSARTRFVNSMGVKQGWVTLKVRFG